MKKKALYLFVFLCTTGLSAQDGVFVVEKINEDHVQMEVHTLRESYKRYCMVHKGASVVACVLCAYVLYTMVPTSWKKAVHLPVPSDKKEDDTFITAKDLSEKLKGYTTKDSVDSAKKDTQSFFDIYAGLTKEVQPKQLPPTTGKRVRGAAFGVASDTKDWIVGGVKQHAFASTMLPFLVFVERKMIPGLDTLVERHILRDWDVISYARQYTKFNEACVVLQELAERVGKDPKQHMKKQLCTTASLLVLDIEKILGCMIFATERFPEQAFLQRTRACEIQGQVRADIQLLCETLEGQLNGDTEQNIFLVVSDIISKIQTTIASFELLERVL